MPDPPKAKFPGLAPPAALVSLDAGTAKLKPAALDAAGAFEVSGVTNKLYLHLFSNRFFNLLMIVLIVWGAG